MIEFKHRKDKMTLGDASEKIRLLIADLATLAVHFVVTSLIRSVDENAAVGGKADSKHLTGQAVDIRMPAKRFEKDLLKAHVELHGLKWIDEGDHMHIQE